MNTLLPAILSGLCFFVLTTAHAQWIESWTQRHSGSAKSSDDAPAAVMVDSAGNIVTAGSVWVSLQPGNPSSDRDFYISKRTADGVLLWERNDGSVANIDEAKAMALDSADNVIVTGKLKFAESDFYTAKYAASDGTLLWSRTYNGPGISYSNLDSPTSIAVDAAGNVIVTGISRNAVTSRSGGTSFASKITIKVGNPNPNPIAGNLDFYTAKYAAANGALLWERRYNGPNNKDDTPSCVAVDTAGNVVVTGTSITLAGGQSGYTAKYLAANGALIWEHYHQGGSSWASVDASGDVAIAGTNYASSVTSFIVKKLARDTGAALWETAHAAVGDFAFLSDAIMDTAGNISITGLIDDRCHTAKLASMTGALLWQRNYRNPLSLTDEGACIAASTNGDIVISGQSFMRFDDEYQFSEHHLFVVKYAAADGAVLAEHLHDDPNSVTEQLDAYIGDLTLAADGSVVLAARSSEFGFTANITSDITTIRLRMLDVSQPSDAWKLAHFAADLSQSDDQLDPDHDGVVNLLERATGSDPLTPSHSPVLAESGGSVCITYTESLRASDVTLIMEASTDLIHWQPTTVTRTILSSTATTQTMRATEAAPHGNGPRFLRLRVTPL
jgi:hypothetical protein